MTEIVAAPPAWMYRRIAADPIVEVCASRGRSVALPSHFHDDDQITFVMQGRRRFCLQNEIVTVEAGESALIAAGIVHVSFDEPEGMEGLNLYVPAGDYDTSAFAVAAGHLLRETNGFAPFALTALLQRYRLRKSRDLSRPVSPRLSVRQRAMEVGFSREGFSRAFTREHGMPPHAFGLVSRLNRARGLLRQGGPLVDVALDAGFADQSHLGRCFKRVFGATPGQYRDGHDAMERSQTFQT